MGDNNFRQCLLQYKPILRKFIHIRNVEKPQKNEPIRLTKAQSISLKRQTNSELIQPEQLSDVDKMMWQMYQIFSENIRESYFNKDKVRDMIGIFDKVVFNQRLNITVNSE